MQNIIDVNSLKNQIDILYNSQQYENALDLCEQLISSEPHRVANYSLKASILLELKKPLEALECFDKAIEEKPTYHIAYKDKGKVLADLGKREEAIQCFDKAIEVRPDFFSSYYEKGKVLVDLGKREEAITYFDKVIVMQPFHFQTYYHKCITLGELKQKKEAIQILNKVLNIHTEEPILLACRSKLHFSLGDTKAALIDYNKASQLLTTIKIPEADIEYIKSDLEELAVLQKYSESPLLDQEVEITGNISTQGIDTTVKIGNPL